MALDRTAKISSGGPSFSHARPDFLLDVRGTQFPAHRALVAAFSDPLSSLLYGSGMRETTEGIVRLGEEIAPSTMEVFLHFLYDGRLETNIPTALNLLEFANMMLVEALVAPCVDALCAVLDTSTVLVVLAACVHHSSPAYAKLHRALATCVSDALHIDEFRKELHDLSYDKIVFILTKVKTLKPSPDPYTQLICDWIKGDKVTDRDERDVLFNMLPFRTMSYASLDRIDEEVRSGGVWQGSELLRRRLLEEFERRACHDVEDEDEDEFPVEAHLFRVASDIEASSSYKRWSKQKPDRRRASTSVLERNMKMKQDSRHQRRLSDQTSIFEQPIYISRPVCLRSLVASSSVDIFLVGDTGEQVGVHSFALLRLDYFARWFDTDPAGSTASSPVVINVPSMTTSALRLIVHSLYTDAVDVDGLSLQQQLDVIVAAHRTTATAVEASVCSVISKKLGVTSILALWPVKALCPGSAHVQRLLTESVHAAEANMMAVARVEAWPALAPPTVAAIVNTVYDHRSSHRAYSGGVVDLWLSLLLWMIGSQHTADEICAMLASLRVSLVELRVAEVHAIAKLARVPPLQPVLAPLTLLWGDLVREAFKFQCAPLEVRLSWPSSGRPLPLYHACFHRPRRAGVFYFIGRNGLTAPYTNPAPEHIRILHKGELSGESSNAVLHSKENHKIPPPTIRDRKPWLSFDLGERVKLLPTHCSFDFSSSKERLNRLFVRIEASLDGIEWELLDNFEYNRFNFAYSSRSCSLQKKHGATAEGGLDRGEVSDSEGSEEVSPVLPDSLPNSLPACVEGCQPFGEMYRYFRFVAGDLSGNSSVVDFSLSEVELYGFLVRC